MTKNTIRWLIFYLLIASTNCYPKDNPTSSTAPITFRVSTFKNQNLKKQIRDIDIQTIQIKKSKLINAAAAKKITRSLQKFSWELYSEAKDWCPPPHDGPWGYEVKFNKIYYADNFLSVVFDNFIACYGNPDINKITKNYLISTGDEATPKMLLKKLTPSLFKSGIFQHENHIELSEDAVNILLNENKNMFPEDVKLDCERYLKKSFYAIWIQPGRVLLQPGFHHPLSICQKIFSIKF